MHKCPKCGTEFDGTFCPECGEKFAEEKTCPQCGALLEGSAKFCNECGYAFYETPAPAEQRGNASPKEATAGVAKLYRIVSALPAALFGLFTVLLFLFFLAPVAVTPAIGIGGGSIPSTSYGSVYELSNYEMMSLTDSLGALIAFAALSAAVVLLLAATLLFSKWRDKRFAVAGKQISLRGLLTAVGYLFFFALFLISCILMGQIAEQDGGLGIMKAGAAPVLVLVFTLLGVLASAGFAFAGAYFRKNYPALREAEEEKIAAAKPTAAETWLKKHKGPAVGICAALIVAIVVAIAVPVGLANRHNGTYYAYNGESGTYDMERFYRLKGGIWENENGETGKISFDGEKVTLTYDFDLGLDGLDDSLDLPELGEEGTIQGDILKVGGAVYAKEGHKHRMEDRECICGAKDNSSEGLQFEKSGDHWIVSKGSCTDTDIIIASWHDNAPVTEIKENAFGGSKITSVRIGNGVTTIGVRAFGGCDKLTSIVFPDSVTTIAEWAFDGCSELKSVTFGKGLTSIGESAFSGCKIANVALPDSLTSFGVRAFGNNGGSLESITVGKDNPNYASQDGILYNKAKTEFVYIPGNLQGAVTIPDGVTEIGELAFYERTELTGITIGKGVTSIGNIAFGRCDKLASVVIPDSVTSIGYSAFSTCDGLKSITIGKGVTSIGHHAFNGCRSLASVVIPDGVTEIGESAFYECRGLKSVTIGKGVTSIGENMFYSCWSLQSVVISNGVTSIGKDAFFGCNSLASVVIPKSVTEIGESAFASGLSNHAEIQFQGTVEEWQAIKKGSNWDEGYWSSSTYTVICTDGKVAKDGTVTKP